MSTWVALEPLSATVEAGGRADVSLRVRNTGDIVEEYHVDVVGDPGLWCTVEPSSLRLYPGTTGTVGLTFVPPRSPDAAAGPHPYGVRVRPVETPDAVTVPEGNVSVVPFTDIRAELLPVRVRGWRRARPRLVVDNYGNTTVTAAVQAAAQDNGTDFDIRTPSFQVPPGRAHFSVLKVRSARVLWLGRKVTHPFTTTVQPSGSEPVSVAATYVQTALLPTWLSRLFMLLIGLAAAFVALWFLINPAVTSNATAEALATPTPVAQTQPASAPTSSSSSSSPAGSSSGSSGSGGSSGAGSSQPGQGQAPSKNPPAVTLPAPSGWWKLDGSTGNTAPDSAGTDTATGKNTGWCGTRNCATFNGTSSAFATGKPVVKTGPGKGFTVSAWVFMVDVPADGRFATAVSQGGAQDSGFYLQYSGSNKCWAFARTSTDKAGSAGDRALGCGGSYVKTWVYLTGVYRASDHQLQLYVNGAAKGTASDATPYATAGPLVIGRGEFDGKPTDWFPGAIDNVEVFNQALTSAQVQLLYSDRR